MADSSYHIIMYSGYYLNLHLIYYSGLMFVLAYTYIKYTSHKLNLLCKDEVKFTDFGFYFSVECHRGAKMAGD